MITLKIPWIGPPTNKMYAGQHWRTRMRHVEAGHMAVLVGLANKNLVQGGTPFPKSQWNQIDYPVTLTFIPHHSGRLYDLDGYGYTCKIITDGLVKHGLLTDDKQEFVRGITILPTVKSKDRYMVVEMRGGSP